MIQVRDSKNPARILGTLAKTPALPEGHRFINFAVIPTVLAYWNGPQDPSPTSTYQTVTMEVSWRYSAGGWRKDAHLITDAPLDQLMLLGDFLLPGEDPRAAEDRRYSASLFRDPRRK